MKKTLLGPLAGTLALCALPVGARAADVTFRAEGVKRTLVPLTEVKTTRKAVTHEGNSCSGNTALDVLERATRGAWDGSFDPGLGGFFVSSIRGEAPAGTAFWSLWVNHRTSSTGVCATTMQDGDDVLFLVDRCDGATPANNFACQNPPVLPLDLRVPEKARHGRVFTVRVVSYAASGKASRVAGARVRAAGQSRVSDADGSVRLRAPKHGAALAVRATKAGLVRVAADVCLTSGHDGRCGSSDTVAPRVRIGGIRPGRRFALGRGPRTLAGTAIDAGGLRRVALRLTRRRDDRCARYSAAAERFAALTCGRVGPFFSVGDRETWSYLLPARLGRGDYVLAARASDRHANVTTTRVRFSVGPPAR
jgi:hypothetical protein